MEIILVNPSGGLYSGGDDKSSQYMYPYSLVCLQNYLIKNGIESKMYDLYNTGHAELIEHCKDLVSPIIGVTSQSYNRDNAIELIREIKTVSPTSIIVTGGKHFSYCSEDALKHIKEIDIVVRGEGEITFYELVDALRTGQALDAIAGITYRDSDKIIQNKERKLESKIDKFSLDYRKLPENDFAKGIFLRNYENENIRSFPVLLGRGCSQKCIYCSYKAMAYRVRSLESIFSEIIFLKEKYKKNYFTFSDPSFCERKTFATEFCERLIRENLNIKWYCEARVDTPIELLELMAKAGCISLDFALESGSDKVLKAIRKNIDVAQTLEFAKECNRLGIRSLVFLMVSLPEETEDDAYQTLEMARKLSKYTRYITLSVGLILPGTDLEILAKEKGILPQDFSWFEQKFYHQHTDLGPKNVPLYLENLSVDFIRDFIKQFNKIKFAKYTSYADFITMAKKGIKKIPNQSVSSNLKDVSRYFGAFWNKISKTE